MKAVERCTLIFIGFLLGTGRCFAQPTELFNCLEDGSYCSETPLDTLASLGLACGEDFHVFVGRVAFPPLINRGPITIAVKSLSPHFYYRYPLYVEIVGRLPTDPPVCTTFLAGALVLVTQGLPTQCGGVWESIGPLDLTQSGIPLGSLYHIQVVGFRDLGSGYRSCGLACVTVRAEPTSAVALAGWGFVKQLYR